MKIHHQAGPEILAKLRIVVFGSWLIITFFFSPSVYAELPVEIFEPWGIYRFANILPVEIYHFLLSVHFLTGLKLLLIVGCLLCIAGIRPFKPIAIFTCVLIIIYDFIVRGYIGFINHAQIAIFFSAFIISYYPASDIFSLMGRNEKGAKSEYEFPVIFTGLILTFAYSFIGIKRFFTGGMDIFLNDAIVTYTIRNSLQYSEYGYELGLVIVNYELGIVILKAGFFTVTLMEVLSPFIFFNRYLRYTWLAVIIPFHLITLFTMNIFFWENLLLIFVLFINKEQKFNN